MMLELYQINERGIVMKFITGMPSLIIELIIIAMALEGQETLLGVTICFCLLIIALISHVGILKDLLKDGVL